MINNFKVDFLDHVAISVSDIEKSVEWYEKVIGLKKHIVPEWDGYPVMMLAGKTGLAIFPAKSKEKIPSLIPEDIRIKHFAFNVDKSNFKLAIEKFKALKIPFSIQDHYYFNSIYVKDLDGHEVELTTLNDGFESFYK
ncbi:MAG: VOC family protein [Burkholderiaceae bacterium]